MSQDTIMFLVGLVVTPLALWGISFFKPQFVVDLLVKNLRKVIKDPNNANKIENAFGVKIMKMGLELITNDEDKPEVKKITDELIKTVEQLEKEINK